MFLNQESWMKIIPIREIEIRIMITVNTLFTNGTYRNFGMLGLEFWILLQLKDTSFLPILLILQKYCFKTRPSVLQWPYSYFNVILNYLKPDEGKSKNERRKTEIGVSLIMEEFNDLKNSHICALAFLLLKTR
jgi:hypothetical protein